MRAELQHPFPTVQKNITHSYGGNQAWSSSGIFRACGCGVVACLDLLLYLSRYHSPVANCWFSPLVNLNPLPESLYDQAALRLSRHYLPLIPRHGINGVSLAAGFNLFCIRYHLPYRARWGVSGRRFWEAIRSMLCQDIPVILSIGPNMPLFWQHNKLTFYRRDAAGNYVPAAETLSHYVSVTGIDDSWMQISSWGRKYYISRMEYTQYIREHSIRLVSNILWVEHK